MKGAHYDEEALIELIERGEAAVTRDEHVSACAECAETIASIREFTQALKSDDVWHGPDLNPEPNEQVLATLRAAQARMRAEDAAAETAIKELLAGPRETWMAKLQDHPEWRTAGMVRKLIAATDRAIETMPPDALEIANVAAVIADGLGEERYVEAARFETAYALMQTGMYIDALRLLAQSGKSESFPGADYQDARVATLKAYLYRSVDRLPEAIEESTRAATVFAAYGDHERVMAANFSRALVLQNAGRYREALSIHLQLGVDPRCSLAWRASALQNAAVCYRETGDLDAAVDYVTRAIARFNEARMLSFALHARWTLARIFVSQNRAGDALRVFRELRSEFEASGMGNESALVALDIADVLLQQGQTDEAAKLCVSAMDYFRSAQLTETHFALSALATLREAAERGNVESDDVSAIRLAIQSAPRRAQARLETQ